MTGSPQWQSHNHRYCNIFAERGKDRPVILTETIGKTWSNGPSTSKLRLVSSRTKKTVRYQTVVLGYNDDWGAKLTQRPRRGEFLPGRYAQSDLWVAAALGLAPCVLRSQRSPLLIYIKVLVWDAAISRQPRCVVGSWNTRVLSGGCSSSAPPSELPNCPGVGSDGVEMATSYVPAF